MILAIVTLVQYMKRFPDPISLPGSVFLMRRERLNQLMSSSKKGIAIRLTIIAFEMIGVLLFGSSALMMDALSSLMDVASTLLLILFLKLAAKPPDSNHPFGHGRYEPLMGLQLGLLMIVVGGVMLFQQSFQLFATTHPEKINAYIWLIPALAVVLLELCYHIVMGAAKRQNSPALAADAIHYRIDSITSILATIALVLAAYLPEWSQQLDHAGAIFIAVLMILVGINAARNNLDQIMDRKPDKQFFDKVRTAALRVDGVHDTEKIRIQQYGPDAHVDIDIEVDPLLSVDLAHSISQKVRVEIQKEWPAVRDVTVHIEPYYPHDH